MKLLSTRLVPHSTPNGLSSFDTICLLLFPNLDVVSSPRTSQSSQFINSMRSPTTYVASNQSSQLAHPSYFSNPALMDGSNLPSLHLDTNSPLPQGVAGGVENHPLLRLSPPPLPPHINANALINTLYTFYLPLPLPLPHDPTYFCAIMNSLSIKFCASNCPGPADLLSRRNSFLPLPSLHPPTPPLFPLFLRFPSFSVDLDCAS